MSDTTEIVTLNQYQAEALRTAGTDFSYVERGAVVEKLLLAALGVSGEAGEFTDLVKKHVYHGAHLDRERLIKELGDVLWYLALGADALGATLAEVAQANASKLRKRYPEGFSPKASAERRDVMQ